MLLRKILSLSTVRFFFFHKKLHNPIDHNGFAWNPFFERGSSWMKKEKKKEREKKVVTRGFYGQSLQFVFLAMCERKKCHLLWMEWWCFTGHFFHDSCCISDMKCKCQGSSQSLLAVTVIFLFGSVLFGQQKNIMRFPNFSNWPWKKDDA